MPSYYAKELPEIKELSGLKTLVRQYVAATDTGEIERLRSDIHDLYARIYVAGGLIPAVPAPEPELIIPHGTARPGEYEGFYNYRSPFATPYPRHSADTSHICWYDRREQFETTGNMHDYDVMLAHVTMDNPPSAPKRYSDPVHFPWVPYFLVLITVAALITGLLA